MTSIPVPAPEAPPAEPSGTKIGPVVIAFAIGTAVSIGLGVYGRLHTPTGHAVNIAGFSSGAAAKAVLACIAMALAIVQIVTAMGMYGRIPLRGAWVGPVHRWSGRLAVLISVPVAVHCLYALGFQAFDGRVIAHSIFGCFLYGAFVFKMLILTRDDSPRWALPLAGGLVLSGLTALWMTAVLYFLVNDHHEFPTRRSKHETIRPTDRHPADLPAYGDHERRAGGRRHRRPQLLYQLFNHPGQRAICCRLRWRRAVQPDHSPSRKRTYPWAAARSSPTPRR